MTISNFIDAIQQKTSFTEEELHNVTKRFKERRVEKRTLLLKAGEVPNEVYFVINGCLRLFYEKDGNDISAYFFTENTFAGSYDSFLSRQPSRHSIVALEDCEILSIDYNDMQKLYQEIPKMNEMVRKIMEERFVALHSLFTSQIIDSPEERYINLIQERPDLIQRIPQHYLATFLGVTPVSLSRIRNRVAKK